VLLPSLRRVVIKLPRRFPQNMYIHVVLSSRNLYVQTEADQVWQARIPEPSLRASADAGEASQRRETKAPPADV